MSKDILKLCRKLDRSLDSLRKVLDIYGEIYPNVKETIDNHFADVYENAQNVIVKHDISVCQFSDCSEIYEQDELDEDGYCEVCRED